jgi:molecular chaperone GrpE
MQIPIQTDSEEAQSPIEVKAEISGDEEPSSEQIAHLRLRADFDNLKKRQQREIEKGVTRELGDFFKTFLTIYDDLERAVTYSTDNGTPEEFKEGIHLIHKRMGELLKEKGVERIEALGKPFDPHKHEAVMVEEDSEAPGNRVIEELQPGYLFQGNLLRPARVKVSK